MALEEGAAPVFVFSPNATCIRDSEGSFEERRRRLDRRLRRSLEVTRADLIQRNILQGFNIVRRGTRVLEGFVTRRPTIGEMVSSRRLPPDYVDHAFPGPQSRPAQVPTISTSPPGAPPERQRVERVLLHKLLDPPSDPRTVPSTGSRPQMPNGALAPFQGSGHQGYPAGVDPAVLGTMLARAGVDPAALATMMASRDPAALAAMMVAMMGGDRPAFAISSAQEPPHPPHAPPPLAPRVQAQSVQPAYSFMMGAAPTSIGSAVPGMPSYCFRESQDGFGARPDHRVPPWSATTQSPFDVVLPPGQDEGQNPWANIATQIPPPTPVPPLPRGSSGTASQHWSPAPSSVQPQAVKSPGRSRGAKPLFLLLLDDFCEQMLEKRATFGQAGQA